MSVSADQTFSNPIGMKYPATSFEKENCGFRNEDSCSVICTSGFRF